MDVPFLKLADAASRETAWLIATILISVIGVIGAVKCIAIMRRTTTNALCVSSLLLALTGLLAAVALSSSGMAPGGAWFTVSAMACAGLFIAGIVCGGIGLALYRGGTFLQGGTQAAWGIALNGLLLVGGVAAFVMANNPPERKAEQPPVAITQGKVVYIREANCRVSYATDKWIESSYPKWHGDNVIFALKHIRDDLVLTLGADPISVDLEFAAQTARENASKRDPTAVFGSQRREQFGGMDWIHFEAEAADPASRKRQLHALWLASHAGNTYQLAVIAGTASREMILREGRQFLSSFQLLDPNRTAAAGSPPPAPARGSARRTIELPEFNCRFRWSPPWVHLTDPKMIDPNANAVLRCASPDMTFSLVAGPNPIEPAAFVETVKNHKRSVVTAAFFRSESRETFGGVEFIHLEADLELPNRVASTDSTWIGSAGGIIYQFICTGFRKDRDTIVGRSREIMGSFELIDPNRKTGIANMPAQGAPEPGASPAKSPGFLDVLAAMGRASSNVNSADGNAVRDARPEVDGFSTGLSGLGWKNWPEGDAGASGPLLAARKGVVAYFLVDAIPINAKRANIEDVTAVFLSRRGGHEYPSDAIKTEPLQLPGAASALRFSKDDSAAKPPIQWRGLVALAGDRAFFFVAWQGSAFTNDTKTIDDALATVKLQSTASPLLIPARESQRQFQADTLHTLGVHLSNQGDWQQAAENFRAALRISTHNDFTVESLAVSLEALGDTRGAKELLDSNAERMSKRRGLRTLRGRLRDNLGDTEGAIADYATAFAEGHRGEDDLYNYFNLLIRAKKTADAVKAIEAYMSRGSTPRVRRWLALAYHSAGDSKQAIAMLDELVAKYPSDPLNAYSLGECANESDDFERASGAVAVLLKAGQDNARTRSIEGWSHFGRKSWREAKVSFEKARTFAPESPDIAAALARVSAMLGEGDNSSVKTPIAAVELPGTLIEEFKKIEADSKPPPGASACYLSRATAYFFEKGKPAAVTRHRRVRIVDQAGVSDFGTLSFPFDPLAERIFVNRLVVTDENGKAIAEGQPEEQYVVDQSSQTREATHLKMLRVVVPGLKPGRTLEFTVTTRDNADATAFRYERLLVANAHPALAEAIVIKGDTAQIRHESSPEFRKLAERREEKGVITWLLRRPPVWKFENRLPLAEQYVPILCVGDAHADWTSEARDYLKQIESTLAPDPKIAALALELTAKLKTVEEKVQVLTRHLHKNVTYQAIEFGRRARIPKPPERVLSSHYGDCKDQAVLLHQLLSAAGIPSHLALIHSGAEIQPALPSLDQFNHMIVRVPGLKAGFVDPTVKHFPAGTLPPELFKRQALVLDPGKPRLEAMPDRTLFPADQMTFTRDITVTTAGESLVQETFRLAGYTAAWMRSWLSEIQPAERLAAVQRLLPNARWHLEDFAIDALDKDDADLLLRLRYSIPPPASATPALASVAIPALWEQDYIAPPFLKERRNPFELVHPLKLESRINLQLPGKPAAATLRAFSRTGKSEFCQWTTRAEPAPGKDNTIALSFQFEGKSGTFPASRYPAWQSAWSAAVEAWQTPIQLE